MTNNFVNTLFLVMIAVCLTVGSFIAGLWAVVMIVGGGLIYLALSYEQKKFVVPDRGLFLLALTALLGLAFSNLSSTYPELSWKTWINLATIFLPLTLLLSPAIREKLHYPRLMVVLVGSAFIGAASLGAELWSSGALLKSFRGIDASPVQYNRGMSYLVIMAMPVLGYLWNEKRRVWMLPFFLVLLFATGLTESRASKLALILGIGTMMAAVYVPRLVQLGLGLLLFLTIFWPFAAQWIFAHYHEQLGHIPDSWHHRIEIWDYMSFRIIERPWFGWGLGTSGRMDYVHPHGDLYQFAHESAGHAHNMMTQAWVELGMPGLALIVVFGFFTLAKCLKLSRAWQPFALATWMACFALSLCAYNFWTDSLYAVFTLAALTLALGSDKMHTSSKA